MFFAKNLYPDIHRDISNRVIKIFSDQKKEMDPVPTNISSHLPVNNTIKAVLFDIYGTLFISDSGDIGTSKSNSTSEIFEKSISAAGYNVIKKDCGNYYKHLYESTINKSHYDSRKSGIENPEVDIISIWDDVISILIKENRISGKKTIESLIILAAEYEARSNNTYPMPYLLNTLEFLKNKGIILGIISNAQFYTPFLFNLYLNKSLSDLGFEPSLCIFSYLTGYAKPSLYPFNIAGDILNKEYNIKKESTLFLGNDMLNDILTAYKVGFKPILFAGDKRSLRLRKDNEECRKYKPYGTITTLLQLKDLFL